MRHNKEIFLILIGIRNLFVSYNNIIYVIVNFLNPEDIICMNNIWQQSQCPLYFVTNYYLSHFVRKITWILLQVFCFLCTISQNIHFYAYSRECRNQISSLSIYIDINDVPLKKKTKIIIFNHQYKRSFTFLTKCAKKI